MAKVTVKKKKNRNTWGDILNFMALFQGGGGAPGPGGSSIPDVSGGGSNFSKTIALIITDGDTEFRTEFAPKNVDYSGHENTYNEVARPDRQPLLRRSGKALRKMSMTLLLLPKLEEGYNSKEVSIEGRLDNLEKLAASRKPILVEYDTRTKGKWSITSLSYTSIERMAGTDQISRAEVTIEFTENPNPTPVTLNQITKGKRPKTYKVKKGDTLVKIVRKFYQTDSAPIVKAVAKANKIKNPKHKLHPGKEIKLP